MGNFPTHGHSAGGLGQSPHIRQEKGVPIWRIAAQTRHSGSDTSSVMSPGVCARARTKSLRSSSRVVSVHSRVWGWQTPGIHTQRTQWRRRQGIVVAAHLGDGQSSGVAVTRDHASLPWSRKTTDTTERTLLHPQAPRTQQEFTRARQHSAQHQRARHGLLCVRGRTVVVFRSVAQGRTGVCSSFLSPPPSITCGLQRVLPAEVPQDL